VLADRMSGGRSGEVLVGACSGDATRCQVSTMPPPPPYPPRSPQAYRVLLLVIPDGIRDAHHRKSDVYEANIRALRMNTSEGNLKVAEKVGTV
jgi:hypothetical protein